MSLPKSNGRQPSRQAKEQVRKAFDAEALISTCTRKDFRAYAPRFDLGPDDYGNERFYYHKDNGSNILAVGHLDHVQRDASCTVINTAGGLLACSGALDDRLGVYVILELLPKLGIACDWLLTTDEEMGASTAADFVTDKDYNWIIEFDRGGTDVVMYQYDTEYLGGLVDACGARVGQGSYSDICDLDDLGCSAFNWGVGYADYHSARSHAWLDDTFRMVARFVKFYNANHSTYLPYEPLNDVDKKDDDDWRWMVADCGHEVDVEDPGTYVELPEKLLICAACGLDPT
jgi:hypothetical protein